MAAEPSTTALETFNVGRARTPMFQLRTTATLVDVQCGTESVQVRSERAEELDSPLAASRAPRRSRCPAALAGAQDAR